VYFIGGPNKMWSVDAYNYVEANHPKLWMIESNATYRGWFTGGRQDGAWGNTSFVSTRLADRGAMGTYFAKHLKGTIKMGDSPSVGRLLRGRPDDPSQPGWGGHYVRIWDGRKSRFDRLTTEADQVEVFGVVEYSIPAPEGFSASHKTSVMLDNRVACPVTLDSKTLRFRFSPRDAKVWTFTLLSEFPALHGLTGKFTAVPPPPDRTSRPSASHPNWWIDDTAPESAEGVHPGAKTVSRWRTEFLEDFAVRIERCVPKGTKP
jgi:hypothetical protein